MLTIVNKEKLDDIQALTDDISVDFEALKDKLDSVRSLTSESLTLISSYSEQQLTDAIQSTNWANDVAVSLGFANGSVLIAYVADILPHIETLVGGSMTEMSAVEFGNLLQSKALKVAATEKALEDARKLLEDAV